MLVKLDRWETMNRIAHNCKIFLINSGGPY